MPASTGASNTSDVTASQTNAIDDKKIADTACTAQSAEATVSQIGKIAASTDRVRAVSSLVYVPDFGSIDVLLYRPFAGAQEKDDKRVSYRAVLMDTDTVNLLTSTGRQTNRDMNPIIARFAEIYPAARVSAEAATTGEAGTDFMRRESTESKTIVRFGPDLNHVPLWSSRAVVFVIGCSGADASVPAFIASFDTRVSNKAWCLAFAVFLCILSYCLAVLATFFIRKSQRMADKAGPDHPQTGTNYASWQRHFDPVVLTAGANGRGSPAKLQVLFFSLLILGLVFYIWMLTGHLTGLSTTVLLLMGISGLGATASAGAELTKNRLDFENWAWLIDRGWLPAGGVAEANLAQWKDIVATDGEFDVTRFQMVTFSVLVGLALLGAGAHQNDLSSFDIPQALLGILGLSQVVYVAGKLVAPPSISDLNKQLAVLRQAETTLRNKLDEANARVLGDTVVLLAEDDKVKVAKVAYSTYLEAWQAARTMFETTLGRLVPKQAEELRPPFPVPHVVCATAGKLPDARVGEAYSTILSAIGGKGPYTWSLCKGDLPPGLSLTSNGVLSGIPTAARKFDFTLQVMDTAQTTATEAFTLSVRDVAAG
ncbi:Ig domain-containing protein [Paraburkholderia diazotrophica]|uniref:Ig domain-containing protein n=1 Tax=Paraburkholderia diazotrophica TaxID=667676 RepID=UPI00115FB87E|nr:Ig domain-containing protein [Paraburkholderia diazotrophica]